MVYVNICSAEHLYFFPEQQSETPLPVDKSVPGKAVNEVFAVEGRVGAHKELGKTHWIKLGLPDDHWCCRIAQLTADNKQHTLLRSCARTAKNRPTRGSCCPRGEVSAKNTWWLVS